VTMLEGRIWRVREGSHYVFHLEPPLDQDTELAACLTAADERYPRLLRLLGYGEPSVKDRERFVKINYWLPADPRSVALAKPPEVVPGGDPEWASSQDRFSAGEETEAGIVFARRGLRWIDVVDQMAHEEVHAVWRREVGFAPGLLGEGVAFWFEVELSQRDRRAELDDAWREVVADGRRTLRDLAHNAGFWAAYREGLPVYGVGACLTGCLIETHGLPALKGIYRATYDEDDNLAGVIERQTGVAPETIESRVVEWLPRYLNGERLGDKESGAG
jgi:hypothetical protein